MKYFLDTNICIYFLKGQHENIEKHLSKIHPDHIKIASVVKAELLYGAYKNNFTKVNLDRISAFFFPFEVINFCSNASEQYAKIRASLEKEGRPIGPNDLILASTVVANKGILITNNHKEFSRIKNLKTANWI